MGLRGLKSRGRALHTSSFFLVACGDANKLADVLLRVWRSMLAGLAGSAIAWSVSKLSEASIVFLGAAPALVVLLLVPLTLKETKVRGLSLISKFISGGRRADRSQCLGNH
jgi:hypothetical protein